MRIAEAAKLSVSTGDIVREVAAHFALSTEDLGRRGRGNARSTARKAVAHIAHRRYGIPVVEIARFFNISPPSVSEMLREGAQAAEGISY